MDPDQRSDEQLLSQFLDGDEDSFESLVRRHEDKIFALAQRLMGNRADALDATQETFIRAFRRARSFRGDAAFGTWLYAIGLNACRDMLRKTVRSVPNQAQSPEASTEDPAESVVARVDVGRALASLPQAYRDAVALHDLGGFPYDEIATAEGVPVGTIKSRISRGRRMLADQLERRDTVRTSKETE